MGVTTTLFAALELANVPALLNIETSSELITPTNVPGLMLAILVPS